MARRTIVSHRNDSVGRVCDVLCDIVCTDAIAYKFGGKECVVGGVFWAREDGTI